MSNADRFAIAGLMMAYGSHRMGDVDRLAWTGYVWCAFGLFWSILAIVHGRRGEG